MQRYNLKIILALVLLLAALPLHAALPATSVWEIRPTNGSNNNGGCFDSAKIGTGTDYSQQNGNQYTFADLSVDPVTNTKVQSASHNFVTADVGNCLHITAGVGWTTGWYMITTTASNEATLDRSPAAVGVTGGTFFVGGALATVAQANTNMVQGNIAWIKAEATITVGASTSLSVSGSTANTYTQMVGYTTTRGDNGQVTVQATAGTGYTLININATQGYRFINWIIDCNSRGTTTGLNIQGNQGNIASNILVKNCTANGVTFNNNSHQCFNCTVNNQSGSQAFQMGQGNGGNTCVNCVAYGGSAIGFTSSDAYVCIRCIAANNTGVLSDGFVIPNNNTGGAGTVIINSIAYKNGRDGFRITPSTTGIILQNNIAYGNAGKSFQDTTAAVPAGSFIFNFNAYETGTLTNLTAGANDVVLTANPFVAGDTNNFALNLTAGGGAAISSQGYPGALATGGTGFAAMGALQPKSTAAVGIGFTQ